MLSLRKAGLLFHLLSLALGAPTLVPPPADLTQGVINTNISITAGGDLPNSSAAITPTPEGITGLQLLIFLENLEADFYYEGLQNLTNLWDTSSLPNDTTDVIAKIAAQEEVHVATIAAVLLLNKAPTIPLCVYNFPASNPTEFFAVANLITSANFGSIIGFQTDLAQTNPSIIGPSSNILGVECRHDAFLRILNGEVPNPSPFETGIPTAWAYNIGLQFVVPGSCPVEVPLPTYPLLYQDPAHPPEFANATYPTTMSFTWDANQAWVKRESGKQLYVAWVNLANRPIYTPLTTTKDGAGTTNVPPGLTGVAFLAVTTLQPSNFDDLASATLAGPLAIPLS